MIPLRGTTRYQSFSFINWILIAVNLLVFLFELSLPSQELNHLITRFGMIPVNLPLANPLAALQQPESLLTLFSSTFIHKGWFHFLSNIWILHIFGDNVEGRMGRGRYFLFYLTSGAVANLIQALSFPTSAIPAIGASGAIASVMGAYFMFYPSARILTLVPIIIIPWLVEVPAVFYLGFWFISQLYSGIFSLGLPSGVHTGGVAWWAHIGGFLFGLALARIVFGLPPMVGQRAPD